MSDVLTKPADPDEVLKIVGRVLSGGSKPAIAPDAFPLTTAFDREHLRLLTHRLSEKDGDLRTANERLRALINIGLELGSERNPDRLLQNVCAAAHDLSGATYATLGIVDRIDRTVQRFVTCGTDEADWIKTGDTVCGILETVVAERRTLHGENPGGDPAGLHLPLLHPEVQAFLAAPIASPAQVYGWICLVGNDDRTFTEDDEQLVMALAGQVGRIYELEHEIVERKQAESSARYERDRAERYLETAAVILLRLDTSGRVTLVNRYACSVLGWTPEELLGRDWADTCLPARIRDTFRKTFHDLVGGDLSVVEHVVLTMKSGADFSILNRLIWPDGSVRWLSGAGRILLGGHGEPLRGVGISLDVTARHTLEEQYQQAQKMDAIGRLAGGVAHDFNNLLTVILGHCELLLADRDPDESRQADIAGIQKAGSHASALTRQLLAFSRKQIIEPTLLDLNVVVSDMRTMIGRLIGEHVNVVLSLRPALALVKADRGQLEQIVLNLAVNARDAMPAGGTLTIETANVELDEHYAKTHLAVEPGFYVALTVTDTGTGMTPQVQARLFEPFFTTKEIGKGTGLGLATVHGIVMRSGGSVNVYSEVGKGTAFKVYLPRADAAETFVDARPPVARPHGGTETVLVVEDAEGLRELTKRLLERQGYTVLLAANADEALHLFEAHASIDVLLTDVVMPGASGPELTKQLVERRPALNVIYMSGYTEDAIVHHGVLGHGIAILQKPFSSETLGRKIRDVLDR